MLRIVKAQKQHLSGVMARSFEHRMVEHLRKFFPARCDELGEAGVRDEIRYGTERASSYGIVSEREVCKYIDLMFTLGRDFDSDPALPWATEILNHPSLGGPRAKVFFLVEIAKEGGRHADGTPAITVLPRGLLRSVAP